MTKPKFQLDPRLGADTLLIDATGAWQTRLMDDHRWPWIIIVPTTAGLEDLDDLPVDQLGPLLTHLHQVSSALKSMGVCTSTNVATLSNVVTQMHWHVVGRNEGDPNWPGPVWGYEKPLPYSKNEAGQFISRFCDYLRKQDD